MGFLSSFFGLFAQTPAANAKPPATPRPNAPPPAARPPAAAPEPHGPAPGEALGHLDPQSPAIVLTPSLARLIRPANEVLSARKLNETVAWNPFLTGDENARALGPAVGPYREAHEVFDGKTIIPVKKILAEFAAGQLGPVSSVLGPLVDAVAQAGLLRAPAHKFNTGGAPGARVIFFGGGEGRHHENLDPVVAELGARGTRLVAQWVHPSESSLNLSTHGGTPMDILGNGNFPAGGSHLQSLSSGMIAGKPATVIGSWMDTSVFDDASKGFCAHVLAIDYQAGARDPIPGETLAHYKRNADMWDCIVAMIVPFAGEDPLGYTSFLWNPLEIHDQASARDAAAALAHLDWRKFKEKFGAFYCAEAIYSSANLGPQEDRNGGTLLKKSRFGATRLGLLFKTFGEAPEYAGKPVEWRRRNPQFGWKHLLAKGADAGGVSPSQYKALACLLYPNAAAGEDGAGFCEKTYSSRQGVYLEWIPEDVQGWQAYRPKNREGLIASPLTTGTLAWAVLRSYMPREGVARVIASDIARAYQNGGGAVKSAVNHITGGADPTGAAGGTALGAFALQLASGFMLAALTDNSALSAADKEIYDSAVQKSIFVNAGFEEITTDAGKAKVKEVWNDFLSVLRDPQNVARDRLDAALLEADRRAANVVVERRAPNGQKVSGLMKFVPPGCWAIWAQQPFISESHALRYVGTLTHRSLGSDPVA